MRAIEALDEAIAGVNRFLRGKMQVSP